MLRQTNLSGGSHRAPDRPAGDGHHQPFRQRDGQQRRDYRLRQPQRLFQRHEGAVLALANRVVEIDRATAEHLKGVRPGINLPFSFRNQRVGVIGISGEPAEVRAYAELVKMAAEMMVEQAALLISTSGKSATGKSWRTSYCSRSRTTRRWKRWQRIWD